MDETLRRQIVLLISSLRKSPEASALLASAAALRKRHDVHVLIFDKEGVAYDVKDLHVIHAGVPEAGGIIGRLFAGVRRGRRTKRILRQYEAGTCISFDMAAHAVNVKLSSSVCKILWVNNVRTLKSGICGKADLVLTESKSALKRLRKTTGLKNNTCLYPGFNTERIASEAREEIPRYPFDAYQDDTIVSVLKEHADAGCLADAFAIVAKEVKEMRLLLLVTDDVEWYREELKKRSLEEKAEVLRIKDNPAPYLARSGIYAEVSDDADFPKQLLNAMALSKPVIAQEVTEAIREILLSKEDEKTLENAPGWKKMYGTYGVLLPADNRILKETAAHTLAYEILALQKDTERMRTLCLKSAERASQFDTVRFEEGWETILKRLWAEND